MEVQELLYAVRECECVMILVRSFGLGRKALITSNVIYILVVCYY